MAVNVQVTMKPVKKWDVSITVYSWCLLAWQASSILSAAKSPEIRPGKFHRQLKILVVLIFLQPADASDQLLRLPLCLLLEGAPVSRAHVDGAAAVSIYMQLTLATCPASC